MAEKFLTEAIVVNGRRSPKTKNIEFERNEPFVDVITPALNIKWDKKHELGWQIIKVDGRRSKYYHFVIKDKKTGKKYMPYVETEDENGKKKRIYLDFRNMLFDPEFMRGKVIEIFFVYDHRDMDNTIKTRYNGVHTSFQLDEFTNADLNMSDLARMMRRHCIGNAREDCRFFALQLRAKTLADAAAKQPFISPVFSFGGFAFSFALPSKLPFEVAHERDFFDQWLEMKPESPCWLDAPRGDCAVRERIPELLAQIPVLAGRLAAGEHGMMRMPRNPMAAPCIAHILADERPVAGSAYGAVSMENQPGAKQANEKTSSCMSARRNSGGSEESRAVHNQENRGESETRLKAVRITEEKDETGNEPSGRREKRKAPFKPASFSALSGFKAVIFDLDGVIVDSEMVHPRTFERALAKYNVKIDNAHWRRAYTGIGSYAIFEDLVKKHNIPEDARELVKKRNEIYMEEITRNRLPVIEGFAEVHSLLLENGVKEAVASGGHTNHVEESLRSSGLERVPFISIEMVKRGKPSPEIFLRAAKRLRVKPSECIVFEDSLSGAEAAARAGMPCIALSTTMPRRELAGRAALIVKNYRSKKLKRLLEMLLAKRNKGAKAKAASERAKVADARAAGKMRAGRRPRAD